MRQGLSEYLQHMQKRSFTGIVEAQKEELGVLVEKAKGRKDVPEPPAHAVSANTSKRTLLYNKHILLLLSTTLSYDCDFWVFF